MGWRAEQSLGQTPMLSIDQGPILSGDLQVCPVRHLSIGWREANGMGSFAGSLICLVSKDVNG